LLTQLRVGFQIVQEDVNHARCGLGKVETFVGREPTPNQTVQHRFDEDDRHVGIQIFG